MAFGPAGEPGPRAAGRAGGPAGRARPSGQRASLGSGQPGSLGLGPSRGQRAPGPTGAGRYGRPRSHRRPGPGESSGLPAVTGIHASGNADVTVTATCTSGRAVGGGFRVTSTPATAGDPESYASSGTVWTVTAGPTFKSVAFRWKHSWSAWPRSVVSTRPREHRKDEPRRTATGVSPPDSVRRQQAPGRMDGRARALQSRR